MSPPKQPKPSLAATPPEDTPGCPCGFTAEDCVSLRDMVVEMRKDLTDIRSAVIGHEQYGHKGLIARMSVVERILLVLSLIAVVLGGERFIKFLF